MRSWDWGGRVLQRIEELASFSVARGCGFAMLAIATTMIGLSFDAPQSLKTGAVLSLVTSLVLILKAMRAPLKPYNSTELWLLLQPAERPPEGIAQLVLSRALREAYFRFALYFAWGSTGLLAVVFMLVAAA